MWRVVLLKIASIAPFCIVLICNRVYCKGEVGVTTNETLYVQQVGGAYILTR